MTRRETAERIAELKTSVSKIVEMLLIDDAEFVEFADGMQARKMKKAAELSEEGLGIDIVAERDFLALLSNCNSSTSHQNITGLNRRALGISHR